MNYIKMMPAQLFNFGVKRKAAAVDAKTGCKAVLLTKTILDTASIMRPPAKSAAGTNSPPQRIAADAAAECPAPLANLAGQSRPPAIRCPQRRCVCGFTRCGATRNFTNCRRR